MFFMADINVRDLYRKEWINCYSTEEFENEYTYTGNDLGVTFSGEEIYVKCWSPYADAVSVRVFLTGDVKTDTKIQDTIAMTKGEKGVWSAALSREIFENQYYDYEVRFGKNIVTACDPYAKAVGVNGNRAMFLDLSVTNPDGWDEDRNPNQDMPWTDMLIYELHTRDFSADESSGIKNKGKFLGLVETGTEYTQGEITVKTGLDHLKELGVTHLHLLPFCDYGSLDEALEYDKELYNWGYDPLNYNVPEGTYSTDPFHGEVRVRELKETIQKLHNNGISVVMDVVYNHTYNEEYCYNKLVPAYFHRISEDMVNSDGSACGNDTATERNMVSKFIADSVEYWAREYHIDGFRFDLMGLIDVNTMNEIRRRLDNVRPNIIIYGEGWKLDTGITKDVDLATQANTCKMDRVAMFSDNIRDAIKGSVFKEDEKGYISGEIKDVEELKLAVMGAPEWAQTPAQVVNYTSCHDNYTLFDKIALCNPDISFEERVKQNKLAIGIVMLSQGIAFMHAGEEILRTKVDSNGEYVSDSVRSCDCVNAIKWSDLVKPEYMDVYQYYIGLVKLRKDTELLRFPCPKCVKSAVSFYETDDVHVICYKIEKEGKSVIVAFNGDDISHEIQIKEGLDGYQYYVAEGKASATPLKSVASGTSSLSICAKEIIVLKK